MGFTLNTHIYPPSLDFSCNRSVFNNYSSRDSGWFNTVDTTMCPLSMSVEKKISKARKCCQRMQHTEFN